MNLYIHAAFIVGVFLFLRFIYMKYVEKEARAPGEFIKEGAMCGVGAVLGTLIYKNFYSVMDGLGENAPAIFTGGPEF